MTTIESLKVIGQRGLMAVQLAKWHESLWVPVQVIDVRQTYGRTLYQVTPLHHGKPIPEKLGRVWVNANRVTLEV